MDLSKQLSMEGVPVDHILVEILVDDDEAEAGAEDAHTSSTTAADEGRGRRGGGKGIDLCKYIDHVRDRSCGAIATFEGTTRDTFEGKGVVELRYEAYVPMALRQMRSICASALSTFPGVRRLAVAHRLGVVPVAEASVFIAASSVHRADAFDACRFVIDQLKATVPIWKKEVYADDEVWKRNQEFSSSALLKKKQGDACFN